MNVFHAIQLDWIRSLQVLRCPFFDMFFRMLDGADRFMFSIAIVSFAWYVCSRRLGITFFYLLCTSFLVNTIAKISFGLPRPFHIDSSLDVLHSPIYSKSLGFPSGAAQTAVILASLIFLTSKNLYLRIASILFGVFLCLSKVYLGLHFPSDIVGGLVIGGVIVVVGNTVSSYIEARWFTMPLWRRVLITSLFPVLFAMTLLFPATSKFFHYFGLTAGVGIGILLSTRWDIASVPPRSLIVRFLHAGIVVAVFLALSVFLSGFPYIAFTSVFLGLWLSLFGGQVFLPRSFR